MNESRRHIRHRGTAEQPKNRFARLHYEPDPELPPDEQPSSKTMFFGDHSRSIISWNDSPDLDFNASVNPYRGCEHGCIYCYARPTHEYLGFSPGLDFESKILVKEDAPELLRGEFRSKRWEPQPVALSGVTDPYQPIEARLKLTRRCLGVFEEFGNPVMLITKNALVTRDLDVLRRLADQSCVAVFISVTTLEVDLWKRLEPRTSRPERRLETIRQLSEAGIPTGCMIAPVIPGLTDHELPSIVQAVTEAGAQRVGYILLRLPLAVAPLFEDWLETWFPNRKEKVLSRVRSTRDGRLNDSAFGQRMRGRGIFAEQIHKLYVSALKAARIERGKFPLSTEGFRRPGPKQLDFFSTSDKR